MDELIRREVKSSQSKYKFKLIKKDVTQQGSYYLDLDVENTLIANKVIKLDSSEDGKAKLYLVSDDYNVVLSKNIIAIIGDKFEEKTNLVVFRHNKAIDGTTKFELRKTDFQNKGGEYEWFVELYEKNVEGLFLILSVDYENKKIIFDIGLNSSLFKGGYEKINDSNRIKTGTNKIYYGTPGCGKSFYVDKEFNISGNRVFRTVFHPEYSNADFIGQILPQIDEGDESKILYKFKEGIFTKALKYAYDNPSESVYLIIEEINRGNASSIFGEIFLLLDRDAETKSSIYAINNETIANYLGIESYQEIRIPSNLSIIATMNTSDQNVFMLDTAFKRRWDLIKIRNTFTDIDNYKNLPEEKKKELEYKYKLSEMFIPGSSYTWRKFVEKVNNKISEDSSIYPMQTEDKEIGVFFVSPSFLSKEPNNKDTSLIKKFGEKVLMYLWNDVVKSNHHSLFISKSSNDHSIYNLDHLLDEFESCPNGETLSVFANDLFEPSKVEGEVGDTSNNGVEENKDEWVKSSIEMWKR